MNHCCLCETKRTLPLPLRHPSPNVEPRLVLPRWRCPCLSCRHRSDRDGGPSERRERQKELARIDADELTLYRVEIEDSHTTVQIIAQLNQITQNLDKGNVLDERWQLSEVFHGLPPGKSYYVLAYPPNGQSIYSRACRCVVARMADVGLR